MKKIFFLLMLILTSTTFAIPKGPCDEPKDVCCEEAVGPFAFSYPKDLGLACERGFNVYGEFLLMKGSEEGLEFAMSNVKSSNTDVFPLQVGKFEGFSSGSLEWDWKPGFRVGFGSNNTFDQYNIDIHWTYIRIKSDAEKSLTGAGDYLALFFPPLNPEAAQTYSLKDTSARWSGDFNTLDISVGKGYHVSRYFISNPKFGIRAAWIDQDMTFRYSLISLGSTPSNDGVKARAKNDYWGAGLLAGIDSQFIASKNWRIYTKAIFSLLFGKFDTTQQAAWASLQSSPTALSYDVEDTFYSVQPNAELGAGIAWSRMLDNGQYLVTVKAGYEFIHFWDQNQLRRFFDGVDGQVSGDPASNDTVSRGDLSFNGFQFSVNFDF